MTAVQHQHPVTVVGAGPVGLAAAAHLHARGRAVRVLEAGDRAGAGVLGWSHVRLFSPWSELVDPTAELLLADAGWERPDGEAFPSGAEWVSAYIEPLAAALGTAGVEVRYGARVVGVAREGRDLVVDAGRQDQPFTVQVEAAGGRERLSAAAVVDASGTLDRPNPLGADGLPALGEAEASDRIAYAVPDLRRPEVRARYAGRHVAVAGTGASAQTVLVALARLAAEDADTRVTWLVRRPAVGDSFGGGEADQLPERGALGTRARQAVQGDHATTVTGFRTSAVDRADDGTLTLVSVDGDRVEGVDEVVAVTGYRPDLSWLSEVRLDLDSTLEAPRALAPLIDPNVHSCGSVYPHGAAELAQPEQDLYLAGMKSYGRAPTFLALTGYEQVRSIAAVIDGDAEAAARVELRLPETGVCGGAGLFDDDAAAVGAAEGGCCAPAAEASVTPAVLAVSARPTT